LQLLLYTPIILALTTFPIKYLDVDAEINKQGGVDDSILNQTNNDEVKGQKVRGLNPIVNQQVTAVAQSR